MGNIVYNIISKMSSPSVVQGVSETAPLLENNDTDFEENVIKDIDEFLKFGKQNKKVENNKTTLKRKRKHENNILLTREEFYILNHATSPITRYMKQLVFSSSVIKEYLVDTCEKQPDSALQYGPVDTSIFNRIPHEVEMWRQLRNFESFTELATEVTEETNNNKEEEETDN